MSVGADGQAVVHTDTFCGRRVVDAESYIRALMDIHFNADMSEDEKAIQSTFATTVVNSVVPENEMTLLRNRCVSSMVMLENEQERRRVDAEAEKDLAREKQERDLF